MLRIFKRAIQDILVNSFLNSVAIVTISLCVLIISAFALFYVNASAIMDFWVRGIRIMAYLGPDVPEPVILDIKQKIRNMNGVGKIRFVSKEEALETLKEQMQQQASLLEHLDANPLPDAFEIRIRDTFRNWQDFEMLASRVRSFPEVEEVEYGQQWMGRFMNLLNLFRLTGYALACLFFMAAVFFVANTIRLVLYSRREEVEIMRLVGASEGFIKDPFYIQSMIQGALGGVIGLGTLFVMFRFVVGDWTLEIGDWKLETASDFQFLISDFQIQFLSPEIFIGILLGSMFVGWLGCYISLRQFLK